METVSPRGYVYAAGRDCPQTGERIMGNIGPRAHRRNARSPVPADEGEAARAERLARERQEIEQARASARAGRVVSLEAVEAWIDSLGTDHELPPPRSGR